MCLVWLSSNGLDGGMSECYPIGSPARNPMGIRKAPDCIVVKDILCDIAI